jgi:hypothetical protein
VPGFASLPSGGTATKIALVLSPSIPSPLVSWKLESGTSEAFAAEERRKNWLDPAGKSNAKMPIPDGALGTKLHRFDPRTDVSCRNKLVLVEVQDTETFDPLDGEMFKTGCSTANPIKQAAPKANTATTKLSRTHFMLIIQSLTERRKSSTNLVVGAAKNVVS